MGLKYLHNEKSDENNEIEEENRENDTEQRQERNIGFLENH